MSADFLSQLEELGFNLDMRDTELSTAAIKIGPECLLVLDDVDFVKLVQAKMGQGFDAIDALLFSIHALGEAAPQALSNEFVDFFLSGLTCTKLLDQQPRLRRQLDSGDLLNSVGMEFWQLMHRLEYQGRNQMFSWLYQRLEWKMSGKSRKAFSGKQRLDMQVEYDEAEIGEEEAIGVGDNEFVKNILKVIHRLPEEDRRLIEMKVAGLKSEQMGAELGLAPGTARQNLRRALERVKELI